MFEAKDIHVKRGRRSILNGVSVEVAPGEVIGLIGPNGAGKSTLLKVMSGEVRADGDVRIHGRSLADWNARDLACHRAVLSQHSELNFPLTAFEVVMLGRNPHIMGGESAADRRIATEALELVDATHLAEQVYPTLSGGEKQRVQLARVLSQIWEDDGRPRYLMLDEPTSSLDLAHQHLTLEIARGFARRNTGVLIVLHDIAMASAFCDRICMLKDGVVHSAGTPAAILDRRSILDVFDFDIENYRNYNAIFA